jgi:nucleoside-triphosphatase THEP1
MITIVTGKINSGKTTAMIRHYHEHKRGDGFVSIKSMLDNHVDHYTIMRLSTGEEKLLMVHEKSHLFHEPSSMRIGPYHVMLEAIQWVEDEMKIMIETNISPLYLDEIGALELNHQGFHPLMMAMIHSSMDLILVVRESLFDEVVNMYHLKDIKIIRA